MAKMISTGSGKKLTLKNTNVKVAVREGRREYTRVLWMALDDGSSWVRAYDQYNEVKMTPEYNHAGKPIYRMEYRSDYGR